MKSFRSKRLQPQSPQLMQRPVERQYYRSQYQPQKYRPPQYRQV